MKWPRYLLITGVVLLIVNSSLIWPGQNWQVANCDVGQGDGLVVNLGSSNAIVIDVGINRIKKKNVYKIVGDVEFETVFKKARAITPVPGGVGPVTIACLLRNTLDVFKKINNIKKN